MIPDVFFTHSTVVATLRNLFSQFPVEYAVLTIKMLVEQFKNSFRVDLRSSSRGEPNPSQHGMIKLEQSNGAVVVEKFACSHHSHTHTLSLCLSATDTSIAVGSAGSRRQAWLHRGATGERRNSRDSL